jgi:hypothetical protein
MGYRDAMTAEGILSDDPQNPPEECYPRMEADRRGSQRPVLTAEDDSVSTLPPGLSSPRFALSLVT